MHVLDDVQTPETPSAGPWWAVMLIKFGLPTLGCVVLGWFILARVAVALDATTKGISDVKIALEAHQQQMSNDSTSGRVSTGEQSRLLRMICVSLNKNDAVARNQCEGR